MHILFCYFIHVGLDSISVLSDLKKIMYPAMQDIHLHDISLQAILLK